MKQNIVLILIGLCLGLVLATGSFIYIFRIRTPIIQRKIIGFLPYWLLSKARQDYSPYITTLTYFSLGLDADGHIVKQNDQQEAEPGWNALQTGKVNSFFATAKRQGISLSLLVAMGDTNAIASLVDQPISHANNLVHDVIPIMKHFGFSDLNLDIESSDQNASSEAQMHFAQFIKEVKNQLQIKHAGTLTVEILGSDLIRNDLINPKLIASFADSLVIMAYDFHYQGSAVTGAVAPLAGAGTSLEFDTQTVIQRALVLIQAKKIILGIPLYGYEWETLLPIPHAAVIPGSGLTASNARVEALLAECATCSAHWDQIEQEYSVIYHDSQTGTYHEIFYPDMHATAAKVNLATQDNLGGIALWALGYEGKTILKPLKSYKMVIE